MQNTVLWKNDIENTSSKKKAKIKYAKHRIMKKWHRECSLGGKLKGKIRIFFFIIFIIIIIIILLFFSQKCF